MADTSRPTNAVPGPDYPGPLLATKLFMPPARQNLVPRPRLLHRLSQGLERIPGVILVSAPPGYGKTTLVSSWLHQLDGQLREPRVGDVLETGLPHPDSAVQFAWLSLDEADNDPARFLAYCVAALQPIQPGLGLDTVADLNPGSASPASSMALITALINKMVAISSPYIFVFEDYHVVENQLIHDSLSFLIDNLPARALLVITSRTRPPLPLARLRGRGQLVELGSADLRFAPDEVAPFLNRVMGLDLSNDDVAVLEARTEGWVAGLQMAALSMQGLKDVTGFVNAFGGSHHHVMEYLLQEVLDRQPERIKRFLLETSILNRLSGPLCEAVVSSGPFADPAGSKLETRDSGAHRHGGDFLKQLEQANLFVMPLDEARQWYRYHPLFADLLRHRLEQIAGPQHLTGLHRRASDWYEQHDLAGEAMSHALAAMDMERIIRLAKQKVASMLSRSELVTVLSWLDSLPQDLAQTPSRFPLVQAWAMALMGQLQVVEPLLVEAERHVQLDHPETLGMVDADVLGEISVLRATVAYFQRDMKAAVVLYSQALAHLSPDNLFLRGVVMQGLGSAHSWSGDVVDATQAFTEASAISLSSDNMQVSLIALWNWARLQVEQGHLHQAHSVYQRAIHLFDQQNEETRRSLLSCADRIYIGLAEVLYQWNELDVAAGHAISGKDLAEQGQESDALASAYLQLTRIKQAQGNRAGAVEAVQQAGNFARRHSGPQFLTKQVEINQARLWLAQGNFRPVADWIRTQDLQLEPLPDKMPYLREGEYLLLARLLLIQSQMPPDDSFLRVENLLPTAADLLERITLSAREKGRIGRVIEALVLQSLVWLAQDEVERARFALQDALSLAEPEGYVRCFIDEGPPIADLLRHISALGPEPNYAGHLLAALEGKVHVGQTVDQLALARSQLLLDPLSERELEILQLIATGMSNRDLAEELVVTVGTVKWHLNNIYSKLAVRSRTQAVAKAREIGLI